MDQTSCRPSHGTATCMIPWDPSSSIKQFLASALVSWRMVWQRALESPMDSSTRSTNWTNIICIPWVSWSKKCQKTETLTDYMDLNYMIWHELYGIIRFTYPVPFYCFTWCCAKRENFGLDRGTHWTHTSQTLGPHERPPPEFPMASIHRGYAARGSGIVSAFSWVDAMTPALRWGCLATRGKPGSSNKGCVGSWKSPKETLGFSIKIWFHLKPNLRLNHRRIEDTE